MSISSPIGIDLGAENTAVVFYHNDKGKISDCHAVLFSMNDASFTVRQTSRRQMRHLRRNIKRKKLARRLVFDIARHYGADLTLPVPGLVPAVSLAAYLAGLLKRRGYTFLSLDEKLDDLDEQLGRTLTACLREALPVTSEITTPEFADFLGIVAAMPSAQDIIAQIAGKLAELKSNKNVLEELNCTARDIAQFHKVVTAFQDALEKDQRNRRNYLAYLKAELAIRAPLPGLPLGATQLYYLLGNIANMQQRDLRHYFNGIMPDMPFDTNKLFAALQRSVNLKHTARFAPGDGLACLLAADPETTCPGYEDHGIKVPRFENQNNRRPPRCPALRLNPHHPHMAALLSHHLDILAARCVTEWFPHGMSASLPPLDVFQMVCDANRLHGCGLREYFEQHPEADVHTASHALRANARFVSLCHWCDECHLPIETLLTAAQSYTAAITLAAKTGAVPDNAAVRVCLAHPPLKAKAAGRLAATLLLQNDVSAEKLACCIKTRRLLTALTRVADAVKKYRSGISLVLQAPPGNLREEIDELNRNIQRLAALLDDFVAPDDPQPRPLHRDPFVLSQLYHILFDQSGGFAKNCAACTAANHARKLNGVRQLARSDREFHRPFDGMAGRIIDRLAWEIARRKSDQLRSIITTTPHLALEIPIALEANSFRFSLEMANKRQNKKKILRRLEHQITGADDAFLAKRDRIKADARGICAYCGLPLGDDGEIDHIIPRALDLQNAEFNLIYVHTHCNRKKGKNLYTLANIAPAFRAAYGLVDDAQLRDAIQQLISRMRSAGVAAAALANTDYDRTLCRLGLLHPDFAGDYRALLAGRRVATVNGTQRYLKARIVEKLHLLLDQLGHSGPRSFPSYEAPAQEISEWRRTLRTAHPELPAKDDATTQSAYSHVLDAALTAFSRDPHYAGDIFLDLPRRLEIATIESRPKHLRLQSNPAASAHFKDTLYAERFVPILLTRSGSLLVGFSRQNAFPLPGDALLRTLFPLLKSPAGCDSFATYFSHLQNALAQSSAPHIAIVIDRAKYVRAAHQRVHATIDAALGAALVAADQLRYYTLKSPVLDEKGTLITLEDKQLKLNIKLDGQYIGQRKNITGTLELPAAREWQRLREHVAEGRTVSEFFLSHGPRAPQHHTHHQRIRHVFSLPLLAAPAGGVRLYRSSAAQVAAADKGLTAGLNPDTLDFELMPHYARSRRVVPTTLIARTGNAIPIGFEAPLSVPDGHPHILRAAALVGADSTRQTFVLELSAEALREMLGCDPLFSAPPRLKADAIAKDAWKRLIPSKFSTPRDFRCDILTLTPHSCVISYTGPKKPDVLAEIAAAWRAHHPAR